MFTPLPCCQCRIVFAQSCQWSAGRRSISPRWRMRPTLHQVARMACSGAGFRSALQAQRAMSLHFDVAPSNWTRFDRTHLCSATHYCWRHTCGTRWAEAGMDKYTVARLMGHSSPRVAERYYIHVTEPHCDRRVRAVPGLSGAPTGGVRAGGHGSMTRVNPGEIATSIFAAFHRQEHMHKSAPR